jgi:hypothetical protein
MFTFAFLLFVAYLIITVRSDNVDFDLNGTKIPNLAENNVYQLYINNSCASGSYQTFKHANSGYISTNKDLIISYADNDINCQVAAPTNAVVLFENSTPTSDDVIEYKVFIKIPKNKYPYIQITGFDYEASTIGIQH